MKLLSLALFVLGLALAAAVIAWSGAGDVWHALQAAGPGGCALFTLCQFGLFLLLGLAWRALTPEIALPTLIASRAVRDAASNCLPFSHLGGLALGVRAAILRGVPWGRAAASSTADVTAEFFGQLAYAALSLTWLLLRVPGAAIARPVAFALVPAAGVVVVFILAQNGAGRMFASLGRRIAGDWGTSIGHGAETIDAEFARVYAKPWRLAACSALHLLAWLGSGLAGFVAYRALGSQVSLGDAIAIDGLVAAAMIFAFLIPGQLGAQEAAYAAMGHAFGIPPALSIGVSLLRRGRDIGLGVPILLAWQWAEARRLAARRP